jgi:GAF domain-containing protein
VPLKLGDQLVGALALFRLLPQKAGFEPLDRELFELLATHAATALYSSELRAARAAAGSAA